jgi:hypothetical protein
MENLKQALELLRGMEISWENEGKEQEANTLLNVIWKLERLDTTGVV